MGIASGSVVQWEVMFSHVEEIAIPADGTQPVSGNRLSGNTFVPWKCGPHLTCPRPARTVASEWNCLVKSDWEPEPTGESVGPWRGLEEPLYGFRFSSCVLSKKQETPWGFLSLLPVLPGSMPLNVAGNGCCRFGRKISNLMGCLVGLVVLSRDP